MSTTPVNQVVTDADVEAELGNREFQSLIEDGGDGKDYRQKAFDDLLDRLANRVPPIREANIVNFVELKRTLVLGTCAQLYLANMTTGDDVYAKKYGIYSGLYERQSANLRPTVSSDGTQTAAPASIALHRR